MRYVGLALVVAACSSGDHASDPPRVATQPVATTPATSSTPTAPAAAPGPLHLTWGAINTTTDCFYFSGPDGRDDQLVGTVIVDHAETPDGKLTVKIGTATFTGTYIDRELSLRRVSSHQFGGAWRVTETIRGHYFEGVLRGKYRYEECELSGSACPGRCTIDADLSIQ